MAEVCEADYGVHWRKTVMMEKQTVKKRIFISNMLTVAVTLMILLLVNFIAIKVYWEDIETQWENSVVQMAENTSITTLIEDWTIHRNGFYVLLMWDAVFCIAVLIGVNIIFTRQLIRYLTIPLESLEQGARRIQSGDLTTAVSYSGDREFEIVCEAFNQMQTHILQEQEKNAKYEKARTDMIAGISHDLRTPLTAVKGALKGVMDGIVSTPEQQRRFLNVAYSRTEDMERLLGQLFELSRLETGNIPLTMQRINLTAAVEKYKLEKQQGLQEKEETFVVNIPEQAVFADLDLEQLYRIFDNLFDNSRKYAASERLQMELSLKCRNGEAEFIFSDNGPGVPEEKMPYIFEEFYRADEARSKKSGNGRGLYIVKYLTETMGGTVWAESKDGLAIHIRFQESGA